MTSPVTETPAAPSDAALQHFQSLLSFETDCWDVHAALKSPERDFILLDVRSVEDFAAGHVEGAVSLPHRKIIGSRMREFEPGKTFVVYCAGPHCNGANKAAVRLAQLGLPVKLMTGGITGWIDEGFELKAGH